MICYICFSCHGSSEEKPCAARTVQVTDRAQGGATEWGPLSGFSWLLRVGRPQRAETVGGKWPSALSRGEREERAEEEDFVQGSDESKQARHPPPSD